MKYQESLKFSHPFLGLLMLPVILLFGYGIVQQLIFDQPFGNHPAPDHWLVISALIVTGIGWLLFAARLRFTLDEKGIYYRFFPFHWKTYTLLWSEIANAHVRKYSALSEFGGWGIRINFRGHRAYNVMNDHGQGLEIVKKNGKKILFSTHNPQAISRFLEELYGKGGLNSLQNWEKKP